MIGAAPICMECVHFMHDDQTGLNCDAFPKGIPDAILMGDNNHRRPFSGDNGITFKKGTREPMTQEVTSE